MGYSSGRTGDQTKFLLNKADNHALYKGTVSLDNDVPASLAANALVVGVGSGCEITDEITDSSLRDKNAIVNISATGKAILVPVNGQIITTEGDQTISSVKKITSTFNNGIGKLEIGKIEGSGAPGNYYKRGTLTATENGLLKWIGNSSSLGLTLTADSGSNQFTISETYGYAPFLNLQWFGAKDGTTHTYASYIDFPGDKGTSSSHETLACVSDITTAVSTKANDSAVVHKGTSSSPSNETIYGNKTLYGDITLYNSADPMPLTISPRNSNTNNGYIGKAAGSGSIDILLGSSGRILGGGGIIGVYGLKAPSTTSWSADKIIATTEDCGTKLYKHTLSCTFTYQGGSSIALEGVIYTSNGTPITQASQIAPLIKNAINLQLLIDSANVTVGYYPGFDVITTLHYTAGTFNMYYLSDMSFSFTNIDTDVVTPL